MRLLCLYQIPISLDYSPKWRNTDWVCFLIFYEAIESTFVVVKVATNGV